MARTKSETRRRTHLVGVRLTTDEYLHARTVAKSKALTVPALLRQLLHIGLCGHWSPALRIPGCSDLAAPMCDLPAGHAGWHKDSTSSASWGKRWTDEEASRGE